jgi:hypothetical protein
MTVGGKTYQARKNIDSAAAAATLDLKTLTGLGDGSVTGKVWIEEMEDITNNNGLITAISPADVSYTIVPPFTAVTGITDVPTSGTAGTSLALSGTVAPSTATNKDIVWSVADAGTTGASITDNTLTAAYAGTVTVKATIKNGATSSSDYTQNFDITINRKAYTGAAVNAPTLNSRTDKKVVLNTVTMPDQAVEYAKSTTSTAPTDESNWQDATTFDGLTGGTVYYFFARVKKTSDTEAGGVSDALSVTTKANPAAPAAPTICTGENKPTSSSITINTVKGNEYYISTSSTTDWSGTPNGYFKASDTGIHKFDSLTPATKYYIYVRTPETDDAMPSASSYTAQYAPPATPDASVVTINYAEETMSFNSTYEVSGSADFASTITNGGTVQPSTPYYVRVKAASGAPASESASFTVSARPDAPSTGAYSYDYEDEKIIFGTAYEVYTATSGGSAVASDSTALTPGSTF